MAGLRDNSLFLYHKNHEEASKVWYILRMPIRNHAQMIRHMVQSYAEWWGLPVRVEDGGGFWILKGKACQIAFPVQSSLLIPTQLVSVQVPLDHSSCMLPFPGTTAQWETIAVTGPVDFPLDLLTFLAGQLWRAEEFDPELREAASHGNSGGFLGERFHFFDVPVVDLWVRYLCERVMGAPQQLAFQEQPRFWMTYDIDCLRKWHLGGVVRHLANFPVELLQGNFLRWLRLTREALLAHFPERDPWFTLPQIFAATRMITATFFWLGHPVDHKAYRYNVRRPEYSREVRRSLLERHQVGLHGSPLHANSPEALAREKNCIEGVSGVTVKLHRQHYLRIVPGKTFRHLNALGMTLDSTLGFNDRPGFRCGSCIPIRWWDLEQGLALQMAELPFVAGDWTIHNPTSFEASESRHRIWNLADQVRLAAGVLVLDFHEMYFSKDYPDHAAFHQSVLEGLWMRGWRDWHPEAN